MKVRFTGGNLVVLAIWLAWFAWCVYLTILLAAHVGAWPFAVAWGS